MPNTQNTIKDAIGITRSKTLPFVDVKFKSSKFPPTAFVCISCFFIGPIFTFQTTTKNNVRIVNNA